MTTKTKTAKKSPAARTYINRPAVQCGELELHEDGYFKGHFQNLTMQVPIIVYENPDKRADNQPDYLIETDTGFAFGTGFVNIAKTSKNEYIRLNFRAPELGTVYCNIARAPGEDKKDPTRFVLLTND